MADSLTEIAATKSPSLSGPLVERAKEYATAAKSPATWRAYQGDWHAFERWCAAHELTALPAAPETVALYLTHLAERGRKVAGIARMLVSIGQRHVMAGLPSPRIAASVREVLKGIRRTLGVAQVAKAPVLQDDLTAMLATLSDGLLGVRDRSLLLVGFFGAFRRSELVALDVADLDFTRDGLVVLLRRSKTDPEGQGRKVAIPYQSDPSVCPVRTLRVWLDAASITEGAVFRGIRGGHLTAHRLDGRDVARRVKALARRARMEPAKFAGHSLRAGFVTSAAIEGAPERAIAAQTGHRSLAMLRRYMRDANLFRENAAAWIKLRPASGLSVSRSPNATGSP